MAISFRNSATVTGQVSGGGNVVAKPTGTVSGDTCVIMVSADASTS